MMTETAFVLTFWLLSGLSFLMVAAGLVQIWCVIQERKKHDSR